MCLRMTESLLHMHHPTNFPLSKRALANLGIAAPCIMRSAALLNLTEFRKAVTTPNPPISKTSAMPDLEVRQLYARLVRALLHGEGRNKSRHGQQSRSHLNCDVLAHTHTQTQDDVLDGFSRALPSSISDEEDMCVTHKY